MHKGIFWALAVLIALIFVGCFHDKEPQQPLDNQTKPEENKTGGVEITSQRNFTVAQPTERKPTAPKEVNTGYRETPNADFAAYFIDVSTPLKQGDAILIKKGDLDILIDAGPTETAEEVRNFLIEHGVDDIDVLVSTHADEEHYGGFGEVLEEFGVEKVWWTGKDFSDVKYKGYIEGLKNNGSSMVVVKRGDVFELNGIRFEVLNPRVSQPFNEPDNDAIVLRITDRKFCLMLTSDIQAGPEGDLANMNDIECDVMQAPYHGLGRGHAKIDVALLKIMPEAMVVSGGPNELVGGARQPLIERLILKNIDYYENYENGTLRLTSDGTSFDITGGSRIISSTG